MVLIAPGIFTPPRPFLEGRLVAIMGTVNKYRAMADEYGCVVAMPGARGNDAGADMRENDLLDVIADVERCYPIDRDRIYGCGACEGGTQTFLLAAHHPDLFAAVGALAPAVDVSGAPRGALSPAEPVELLANLTHVPMFVLHSIGDESPFANSVEFVRLCKSKGLDATLRLMSGGSHRAQTEDMEQLLWAFFLGRRP